MSCGEMLRGEEELGGDSAGWWDWGEGSQPTPAFQPSWNGPDTWPGRGAGIKGRDVVQVLVEMQGNIRAQLRAAEKWQESAL